LHIPTAMLPHANQQEIQGLAGNAREEIGATTVEIAESNRMQGCKGAQIMIHKYQHSCSYLINKSYFPRYT